MKCDADVAVDVNISYGQQGTENYVNNDVTKSNTTNKHSSEAMVSKLKAFIENARQYTKLLNSKAKALYYISTITIMGT